MQVYRGLDIGTAKPTLDERRRVPHHLIDLVEPTERFSVDRWRTLAEQCIERLRAQRRTPIVVGGTNLYVRALLDGLFELQRCVRGLLRHADSLPAVSRVCLPRGLSREASASGWPEL